MEKIVILKENEYEELSQRVEKLTKENSYLEADLKTVVEELVKYNNLYYSKLNDDEKFTLFKKKICEKCWNYHFCAKNKTIAEMKEMLGNDVFQAKAIKDGKWWSIVACEDYE